MDVSRETLKAAKSLSASDGVFQPVAEGIPFRSESLDAIFVQHVIEHLHNSVRACLEWNRALWTGARLVVVTPNARYPDPSIYEDPTHIHIFDPRTLRTLLVKTGHDVDTIEAIFPSLKRHTVFGLRHRRLFSPLCLYGLVQAGASWWLRAKRNDNHPLLRQRVSNELPAVTLNWTSHASGKQLFSPSSCVAARGRIDLLRDGFLGEPQLDVTPSSSPTTRPSKHRLQISCRIAGRKPSST